MSEPPHTSREYAYVSITGPGTHEAVTQRLGIEPSEARNVGDINSRTGRPFKGMRWKLQSGHDDTHPLTEHISSLLLIIGLKARELREMWVDYDVTLQCVGYYPTSQGPGAHFDREVVRQAAQLGLAIDCDFYFIDCERDG
jgi:hypothetical protein